MESCPAPYAVSEQTAGAEPIPSRFIPTAGLLSETATAIHSAAFRRLEGKRRSLPLD